ncbi:MAG: hypothetical protein WCG55_01165 [bacterium]
MEFNQSMKVLFTDNNEVRHVIGQIRPQEKILITCEVVYGFEIPLSVLSYIAPVMRLASNISQAEVIFVMKPYLCTGYSLSEMKYGGMLVSTHFTQYIHEYYQDIEHRTRMVLDNVSLSPIAQEKVYDFSNVPTDEKEFINWIFPNRPYDFDRIIRVDTTNSSFQWLPYLNQIAKFSLKTCTVHQLIAQVDQDPNEYSRCHEASIYNSQLCELYPYGLPDTFQDLFFQITKFNSEHQQSRLNKNYTILLQDFAKTRIFYPEGRINEQTLADGYTQMQKFANKWIK